MIIYTILRLSPNGGIPPSSKRATLAAMWTPALLSSVVLAEMHWAAAIGVVGMAAVGTLAILCGVRTVPERASGPTINLAVRVGEICTQQSARQAGRG